MIEHNVARLCEFLDHAGCKEILGSDETSILARTYGPHGAFPGQLEAALRQACAGNSLAIDDLHETLGDELADRLVVWLRSSAGIEARQRAEGRLAARPSGQHTGVMKVDAEYIIACLDIPAFAFSACRIANSMTSLGSRGELAGDTSADRTKSALQRSVMLVSPDDVELVSWIEDPAIIARLAGVTQECVMASAFQGHSNLPSAD